MYVWQCMTSKILSKSPGNSSILVQRTRRAIEFDVNISVKLQTLSAMSTSGC